MVRMKARSEYEKKMASAQFQWCNQYRSSDLAAGQLNLKREHKQFIQKHEEHHQWRGMAPVDDLTRAEAGERLLREVGGCRVVDMKCRTIASRIAEKINRDGEQMRKEHRLIPVLDNNGNPTGHEVRASEHHSLDIRTVDFLEQYTADTVSDLIDIVRAKWPEALDDAIHRKPGLRAERRARRIRRDNRRRRNNRARLRGSDTEPDTDPDEIVAGESDRYGKTLAFYADRTKEHYEAPPFIDHPVIETLTEGEETDGEALHRTADLVGGKGVRPNGKKRSRR